MATLIKNIADYSATDKTLVLHNCKALYGGTWEIYKETLIGQVTDSMAAQARKDGNFV